MYSFKYYSIRVYFNRSMCGIDINRIEYKEIQVTRYLSPNETLVFFNGYRCTSIRIKMKKHMLHIYFDIDPNEVYTIKNTFYAIGKRCVFSKK